MIVKVVKMGNSQGIRIPKQILEKCGINDSVKVTVEGNRIVITPVEWAPRQGWAEEARRMREAGDDVLLIPDVIRPTPVD